MVRFGEKRWSLTSPFCIYTILHKNTPQTLSKSQKEYFNLDKRRSSKTFV